MFQRDRFDKPYVPNITIDNKLIVDAFLIAGNMNVSELGQFMMINMIPYSIVDMSGNTLIHKVISEVDITKTEYQRLIMIKFLYNENVNPDAPNNINLTPLHFACIKQYKDIINFLLSIKVDVNYKDNFGNTPLHRLMTGNIIPETNRTQGNIIPASKKIDTQMVDLWKQERSQIWEKIKISSFITTIDKTLQSSIGSEDEEKNVVKDFQERYIAMNLDLTKQDDIKKAKDLKGASMNRFKEIIEHKWNKFSNNSDITIHNTETYSYPPNLPNKLSVIKNADGKQNIISNIKTSISQINDNANITGNEIDVNLINRTLMHQFLIDNFNIIEITHAFDLNNFNLLKSQYEKYNEQFRIKNTIDFSDDIIDIDNKTFMGGNHLMTLLYIDNALLLDIIRDDTYIIEKLLYCMVIPPHDAVNFVGNYDLAGNYNDLLIQLLVTYINDTLSIEDSNNFIAQIARNQMWLIINNNLSKHFSNMLKYNKIIWLQSFLNKFNCNMALYNEIMGAAGNIEDVENITNMVGSIHETILYLISGMIHNKTNLKLSISYAMRPKYIKHFCDPINDIYTGFAQQNAVGLRSASIISALVYLIMSPENVNVIVNNIQGNLFNRDDIINHIKTFLIDNDLKQIILDTFNLINNDAIPRIDNLNEVQSLCFKIKNYCDMAEQPPRLQEVLNIIEIIQIQKKTDYIIDIYDKIRGMYKDFNFTILANIHTNIPGFHNIFTNEAVITTNIKKHNLIFGSEAFNYWLQSECCLPSEVNFFIVNKYKQFEDVPGTVVTTIRNRLNVAKYIESHMLGLEYTGIMAENIYIPTMDINNDPIITPIQLYNNINVDTPFNMARYNTFRNSDLVLNDLGQFTILKDVNNTFPTCIINYIGRLLKNINNVQSMINDIITKVKFMFANFKIEGKSTTYATVIAYAYPYLVTYSKYLHRMSNIMKSIMPQYTEVFNYIHRTMRLYYPDNRDVQYNFNHILNNIDTFNLSNFEMNVNIINANLFLYYYMHGNNEVKIPKFIYHQLGNNPLLVFDKSDSSVSFNKIEVSPNPPEKEDIDVLDNKIGSDNKLIGSYQNIYNNTNYLKKEIYNKEYYASKNSKLPPSLRSILYQFYNYHVIETIKITNHVVNDKLVSLLQDINEDMIMVQKEYIKAKIIEELFQLYFKNKIEEYGNNIYNKLLGKNPRTVSIEVEKIFGAVDFNISLNKPISDTILQQISDETQNKSKLLTSLFQFTEMQPMKEQFYIYPEKYFETTMLKNKYRVNINNNIIENIMENGANIFNHNEDGNSAIVMMIKNKYYSGIQTVSNFIKIDDYGNSSNGSPYNYMINTYKAHTAMYDDNFMESQYNEIVAIIQANDTYRHNILKYLDTSFKTVMYMTEHYLSELLYRLGDDFTHTHLINILGLVNKQIKDLPDQKTTNYNNELGHTIFVPKEDYGIAANTMIREMRKQYYENRIKLEKYENENELLRQAGININMNDKITNLKTKQVNIKRHIELLKKITRNMKTQHSNTLQNNPKIIQRYENTLTGMNGNVNCYMEGWKQYIEEWKQYIEKKRFTCENMPSNINIYERNMTDYTKLNILKQYYGHINNIIKDYFEQPRYLDVNKPLHFVNDMLVHLTKTFICSNIKNIIKRILFEYILETNKTDVTNALELIDYMIDPINDYLFNSVPNIFVRNSVGIFKNYTDEMENINMTVAETLNILLDLLATSSPIKIDSYVLNIMKNNVNQYFDTIVYKIINNWAVVVENMFIYNINQYRNILCLLAFTQ